MRAHDILRRPRTRLVQRAHRHLVHAKGVGAEVLGHLVGGDGVLQGLAHLPVFLADLDLFAFRIGPEELPIALVDLGGGNVDPARVGVGVCLDVTLVEQAAVRLRRGHVAEVVQHLVPETRVQQVQYQVLDAADVEVHAARIVRAVLIRARAQPVGFVGRIGDGLGVRRVGVAQLVPGRAGPLRHDVRVARVFLRPIAEIERDLHPLGGLGQRGRRLGIRVLRVEGHRAVVVDLGELDGEHLVGQRVGGAVLVVHDGEGLAPVALAREQPIAQLVLDLAAAQALRLEELDDLVLGHRLLEAVDVERAGRGIDRGALAGEGLLGVVDAVGRLHDLDALETEGLGELEVAGIVGRDGHDRAGAVAGEYVVRDEHRDLRARKRIDGVGTGEDAGLLLVLLAFEIALRRNGLAVRVDRLARRRSAAGPALIHAVRRPFVFRDLVHEGVLGGKHHVRRAEQGVRAGGEHGDLRRRVLRQREPDLRATRAADPVPLHRFRVL